jgi:hypothetical protein
MKRHYAWLKNLNWTKKALLAVGTVIVLGAIGGTHQQTSNLNVTPTKLTTAAKTTSSVSKKTAPAPVITTKTETETQSIPFTSTTAQSDSLAQGTTKVTIPGVNGTTTLTYQITYTNGQQTDKKLLTSTVTSPPTTQVTTVGTYVAPAAVSTPAPSCPNGTYVNSAGNTVCSPYSSPSAPAGATAQCVDGTYSFSQSHSGTCSHHGGVAQWL